MGMMWSASVDRAIPPGGLAAQGGRFRHPALGQGLAGAVGVISPPARLPASCRTRGRRRWAAYHVLHSHPKLEYLATEPLFPSATRSPLSTLVQAHYPSQGSTQ